MLPKRFQSVLLFALSFLAAGLLPLYYSIKYGPAAALTSFAGDAFYYLGIAQRSQHFHGFTFDRLYQTNGFHPLWEWLVAALAHTGVLSFANPLSLVLRVYRVDILLLALASAIFCTTVASLLSRPALALLVSAPGPLWVAVALATPGNGASWSAANGMESALTWFFFSLVLATLLLRAGRNTLALNLLLSVLLGCTVLTRLDEIFLAFSILLTLCLTARTEPRANRRIAALCLPFTSMLTAYLAYNRTAVGAFLPLSGTAKSWPGRGVQPASTRLAAAAGLSWRSAHHPSGWHRLFHLR